MLRDGGQDELRLHEREGVAYALAGSSSEGEIGEAWTTGRTLFGEAFWIEYLWLLPKLWMTVGTILAQKDYAVGRDRVAANLIGGNGMTY